MTKQVDVPAFSVTNFTRRRLLAGSFVGVCTLAITGTSAEAQVAAVGITAAPDVVPTKAIHQVEDFKATPQHIYEALLDSRQFTTFSGGRTATIDPAVGGTFSLFAGHIIGRNLELVPNHRIVQAWRVVPWPDGIYSIARFELTEHGTGSRIIFDHTGFPPELAEHLASGWKENYWTALRKYFA